MYARERRHEHNRGQQNEDHASFGERATGRHEPNVRRCRFRSDADQYNPDQLREAIEP